MIKEQKEKYSWMFAFIGADIDVEKTSLSLGIDSDMAFNYSKSSAGVDSVYCYTTAAISSARGFVAQEVTNASYDSVKTVMKDKYNSITVSDNSLTKGSGT